MKFKLLAGQHIQADPDYEPTQEDKFLAKETGRAPRAPSRKYNQGDTVETDTDLVKKFGSTKFQLLEGGKRSRGAGAGRAPGAEEGVQYGPETTGSSAPGGQVSSGFQECTSLEDRTVISGLKDEPVRGVQPAGAVPPDSPSARAAGKGVGPTPGGSNVNAPAAGTRAAENSPAAAMERLRAEREGGEGDEESSPSKQKTLEEQYGAFDDLTLDELREIARDEEVDLGGARRKEEVIAAMRAHKGTK